MFWLWGECLAYSLINFPNLSIISHFFPQHFKHGLDYHILQLQAYLNCVCIHPINPMGIHLLHYAHENVRTGTYDAIHNIFVTIAQGANIHMRQEQLYVIPLAMFNSFH